jgi:hypothetical protein
MKNIAGVLEGFSVKNQARLRRLLTDTGAQRN